jgi:2-polyprenyl-3-methyl-5-hydroxy-6-metoxy-1,4-benzoquinol methylase
MLWTGERVLPMQQQHDVRDLQAHAARYLWAMRYCVHKNVLDAACGEGYGTWILSWAADFASGIDIDKQAITEAYDMYGNVSGSRVVYTQMDVENIKWTPACVDVAVSFETIEHLKNPEKLVQGIRRILKPGGLFIVSAPENSGSTFHVKDYTKQELYDQVYPYFDDFHYFVQDVEREMEIRPDDMPTSMHPTHIFVCKRGQ